MPRYSAGTSIRKAFEYCENITRSHYENFPVASLFIPKERRPFICSIYAFARTADDIADEGSLTAEDRLRRLDEWQGKLDDCFAGNAEHPIFIALAETVARTGIPRDPLADLLTAFRLDVTKNRFDAFTELLHYCEFSANPVGKLVLYIFGDARARTIDLSNHICTGLQLANFWQDVSVDRSKGRIYIPLEDFCRFGYTESDLAHNVADDRFRRLIQFQVGRTREFFMKGKPLVTEVVRDLRCELALTVKGGLEILTKIEQSGYDVLTNRPRFSLFDKLSMILTAVLHRAL